MSTHRARHTRCRCRKSEPWPHLLAILRAGAQTVRRSSTAATEGPASRARTDSSIAATNGSARRRCCKRVVLRVDRKQCYPGIVCARDGMYCERRHLFRQQTLETRGRPRPAPRGRSILVRKSASSAVTRFDVGDPLSRGGAGRLRPALVLSTRAGDRHKADYERLPPRAYSLCYGSHPEARAQRSSATDLAPAVLSQAVPSTRNVAVPP